MCTNVVMEEELPVYLSRAKPAMSMLILQSLSPLSLTVSTADQWQDMSDQFLVLGHGL